LASNENPLGPSPLAVKAIKRELSRLNRYPDGSGYYLKSRLSEFLGLPKEQIIIGNGSNELIELVIRTFVQREDHVIQAFPTFLVYEKVVTASGAELISIPLKNFRLDLDSILKAVNDRSKVIFINNPNNPTGSALLKHEVEKFLRALPQDVLVVLDEAYIDFVFDPEVANGRELLDIFPRILVLRTFSKLYGLAGLRVGYGFAGEAMIDYMNRVRQPFNVNTLAQAGARAALDDTDFVNQTQDLVKKGLAYLYQELDKLKLEYLPTHTNFMLIKVKPGGEQVYQQMLKQGVIVRSMDSYGLNEYIRINVGLPEENERFVKVLKRVLSQA
jgi:histidinol-phosphate aminotransferase